MDGGLNQITDLLYMCTSGPLNQSSINKCKSFFFGVGSNHKPCIYYALPKSTEQYSR